MGSRRIYSLPNTAYDGGLRIPVDKEGQTTGSIELSSIPGTVRTVNGISPDDDGNVSLGFNENELYKFQRVNSFADLAVQDIKSGFCYYTTGESVEGKPLRYIDRMCIVEDVWTFVTPTVHYVTLKPGTYGVVAIAGGGSGSCTVGDGYWRAASGGSGAFVSCEYYVSADTNLSVEVGKGAKNTAISSDIRGYIEAFVIVDHGVSGWTDYLTQTAGRGGMNTECVVDLRVDYRICGKALIVSGNAGAAQLNGRPAGGNFAVLEYEYGGGQGSGYMTYGTSYKPQSGYVKIWKIS